MRSGHHHKLVGASWSPPAIAFDEVMFFRNHVGWHGDERVIRRKRGGRTTAKGGILSSCTAEFVMSMKVSMAAENSVPSSSMKP